jgi:hypothetical protein
MIPYLATFNPNQNEMGDHFFFSFFVCFWGHEKQVGRKKQKRWYQMYHQTINLCFGLHCFLCIFLRGKGTNPKNIITIKLGDLKQLMK